MRAIEVAEKTTNTILGENIKGGMTVEADKKRKEKKSEGRLQQRIN